MNRRKFIRSWVVGAGGVLIPRAFGQQVIPIVSRAFHIATTTAASYLLAQGFEGTGYDNSETWTASGTGTADPDASTSGLSLEGSQCAHLVGSTQTATIASPSITALSDVWAYCLLRFVSTGATARVFGFYNGSTIQTQFRIRSGGSIDVLASASAQTVGTMSTGTTYHLWFRQTTGSGANSFGSVGFSTDGTRPTSGNNYAEITTGNVTTNCNAVRFGSNSSATFEFYADKVRVDDVQIGDNPS